MSFIEIIRSVLLNLKANKFRVFLTSLGIIIGSFTIIMVVGIGKGSEQAVAEQYKKLSVETIMIRKSRTYRGSKEIEVDKLAQLKELQSVKEAGVTIGGQTGVSYGSTTENLSVLGITESIQDMSNLELAMGEQITDKEGEKRDKVALVGYSAAQLLFGEDISEGLGKQITIKGRKYTVKGILKRVGDSGTGGGGGGGSTDDSVFIPYEVAEKYTAGSRSSANIMVQANDFDSVAPAIEELTAYIEEITGVEDAYTVTDAGSKLSSAQETAKTMSTLLISIATIVLIVGGIGIMNVLFVSVKERTREIGILKSIGADRKDILLEFLMESIVISMVGGSLGSILSIAVMPLMRYIDLKVIPSGQGILFGMLFSIVTGTFFGYYPAVKASKLKPIEALNYD